MAGKEILKPTSLNCRTANRDNKNNPIACYSISLNATLINNCINIRHYLCKVDLIPETTLWTVNETLAK
jgi:hypothetical protein